MWSDSFPQCLKTTSQLPQAFLSVPLPGIQFLFCYKWWKNTKKLLKGLNAHSEVLSTKVMHDRIPGDFQNETIADTRSIHLTVMENILTSTQKSASCLKNFTLGNLHSVHRKEERLP